MTVLAGIRPHDISARPPAPAPGHAFAVQCT